MIELLNIKPGELIEHSIVFLFGIVQYCTDLSIKVTSELDATQWPIKNGYFKVEHGFNISFSVINLIEYKNFL